MSRNWTEEQVRDHVRNLLGQVPEGPVRARRGNKYGARKRQVDNVLFDSTAEAEFYQQLKAELRAGAIIMLELQPEFEVLEAIPGVQRAVVYRADFRFEREPGKVIVADVKSRATMTPAARLKHKLFRVRYPGFRLELWCKVHGRFEQL